MYDFLLQSWMVHQRFFEIFSLRAETTSSAPEISFQCITIYPPFYTIKTRNQYIYTSTHAWESEQHHWYIGVKESISSVYMIWKENGNKSSSVFWIAGLRLDTNIWEHWRRFFFFFVFWTYRIDIVFLHTIRVLWNIHTK